MLIWLIYFQRKDENPNGTANDRYLCVFAIAGVTLQREQDSPLPLPLVILPYMKHGDLRRFLIDTRYGDIPMVRGRHSSGTWRLFEMSSCALYRHVKLLFTLMTMYY